MIIDRVWAMPNSETFKIKPIAELLQGEMGKDVMWVDPFAGWNSPAFYTNDIDPDTPTDHHLDALDYLKLFGDEAVSGVLFDPPYSPRQVAECYKALGKTVNMKTTQSSYWAKLKREIARIVKLNGKCISFSWNSGGIGKSYGFEIKRILLVPHGGWHNDTIVTIERKIQSSIGAMK